MMTRDIPKLKAKGARINLSYGNDGLVPYQGGGVDIALEGDMHAYALAQRISKNVEEWGLDGVDIFTLGTYTTGFTFHGKNAGFHSHVIKYLRAVLPPEKTISYTIKTDPCATYGIWHPMEDVIGFTHKYLDYINIGLKPENEECVLNLLVKELGVPASKIGWMMELQSGATPESEEEAMLFLTNSIRERGLHGLSLYSVNKENNHYYGQFLKAIAEELYI